MVVGSTGTVNLAKLMFSFKEWSAWSVGISDICSTLVGRDSVD